jgi:hypothetical protein
MQTNLVFHIAVPRGLKLQNGAKLYKDVTFDFISAITPYYASIDEVRLTGGAALSRLSDITIACQIYHSSTEADLITPTHVPTAGPHYARFVGSRGHYVCALATRDLLLNITNLLGGASHVLANFSVERKADLTKRLDELNDSIKFYEVVIRSGGRTMPGGRPEFRMAAKGVLDWTERTPSRGWMATGMGANVTSMDPGSSTGGRGKPVKFFASPVLSPPMSSMRLGVYQAGYPIAQMYPYPMGA